jgi:hypothetical protein
MITKTCIAIALLLALCQPCIGYGKVPRPVISLPGSLPNYVKGFQKQPKSIREQYVGQNEMPTDDSNSVKRQMKLEILEGYNSPPTNTAGSSASSSSSSSSESQQCVIEENVAYVGATLSDADGTSMRIKGVQSPSECCGTCACIEGCKAWTWSPTTKICYPKAGSGYKKDPMRYGIYSGTLIDPKQKYYARGTKIWEPKLTVGEHSLKTFGKVTSTSARGNNKHVVKDPTCSTSDPVVRAIYEEGRWSPGQGDGGGVLFFAWPFGKGESLGNTVRLEYEVYFPENFPWVKGGKLPGIIGGRTGCGGGDDADDCFSVRVMWRRNGDGEAYIYTNKDTWTEELCDTPGTRCESKAGMSLMRGAFKFDKERWIKIAITVSMNDLGKSNGYLRMDVDGETKIESQALTYRSTKDVFPEAFTFSTWFGGGDVTWSPSTTVEAYFRGFAIYRL